LAALFSSVINNSGDDNSGDDDGGDNNGDSSDGDDGDTELGSGLIDQSQKRTAAAMQIAEK
jgi:hypothetical protein